MYKKFLLIVLLVFSAIGAQSQRNLTYKGRRLLQKSNNSFVHSVNLSFGIYAPKMDYFNDVFLPISGSNDKLGRNSIIGGNITFKPMPEVRARLSVSYWNDSAKREGIGFNKLSVSFTRFSLGGFYAPEFAFWGNGFQFYMGAEAHYYDINNTLDMYLDNDMYTSEKQNGYDLFLAPLIGLDKIIAQHFLLGVELTYVFGKYTQSETEETTTYEVAVDGPQLTISLGYKF